MKYGIQFHKYIALSQWAKEAKQANTLCVKSNFLKAIAEKMLMIFTL